MTSPNVLSIIKGPVRMILTPTNLSATYPYGGTEMGLSRAHDFRWGMRGHTERAEEWGGAPTKRIYTGDWAVLAAVLRSTDPDAIAAVFPSYVAGASGAATVVPDVNGSARAGKEVTGVLLLLTPKDSPTSQNSLLIYNALPQLDAAAALQLSRRTEGGVGVAFEAAPDSSGRLYGWGLLSDLSL